MPTTVITTIKSSGGDHSTIAAWEAATDNDLVTNDEIQQGDLYDKGGAWAENLTIAGATVDATRFRRLFIPTGERHDGKATGAFVDPSSDGHAFTIDEDEFRVEGIRVTGVTGNSSEAFRVNNTGFNLSKFVIHDIEADRNHDGIYLDNNSLTIYVSRGVFLNLDRSSILIQGVQSCTVYAYNLAGWNLVLAETNAYPAIGCHNASNKNNTSSVFNTKNCSMHGVSGRDAFHGGRASGQEGTVNCTSCAAHDDSITGNGASGAATDVTDVSGNNENVTQADQYVSLSGTIDLHAKASATVIEDAGADLSADANLSFTDDIDGDVFNVWDIGADENSPAGGFVPYPNPRYALTGGMQPMGGGV